MSYVILRVFESTGIGMYHSESEGDNHKWVYDICDAYVWDDPENAQHYCDSIIQGNKLKDLIYTVEHYEPVDRETPIATGDDIKAMQRRKVKATVEELSQLDTGIRNVQATMKGMTQDEIDAHMREANNTLSFDELKILGQLSKGAEAMRATEKKENEFFDSLKDRVHDIRVEHNIYEAKVYDLLVKVRDRRLYTLIHSARKMVDHLFAVDMALVQLEQDHAEAVEGDNE